MKIQYYLSEKLLKVDPHESPKDPPQERRGYIRNRCARAFGWEGLGHLLWSVVWSGSLSTYGSAGLLLGIVYAYALIHAALRFALEVLYVVLDPRIRY